MKLKKTCWSLLLLFLFLFTEGQNKVEKIGLISELVYLKYSSEAIIFKHTANMNSELKSKYNSTRIAVDQILLQMEADIQTSNSLIYYKQLDKLLTENSISSLDDNAIVNLKVKGYVKGLVEANKIFNSLVSYDQSLENSPTKGIESIIPIITGSESIVSNALSIIKTYQEIKSAKAKAINTMLDNLRLLSTTELLKKPAAK